MLDDPSGLIVLMAGAVAERLVFGNCDLHGVSDDQACWTEVDDLGVDEALWWSYTVEAMVPHLGLIGRVAAALMDAGWLDGGEIDELLAPAQNL